MLLEASDALSLELNDCFERLNLHFLLLPVELHLLLEYFFLNTALHASHARITDFVPAVLVPKLIRLLIARVGVKGASEGELQLNRFLVAPILRDHLRLDQIVQLLQEC